MKSQVRLEQFKGKRIAVLGDLMLDVYLRGRVERISPEAPVPVVRVEHRNCCLGGGANVMLNLANLGAEVLPFGVIGRDAAGGEIESLLKNAGIRGGTILCDADRRTTEKRRVLAGSQQLLREDYEDVFPVSGSVRRTLVDALLKAIENDEVDAVIFEDYGKGLLDSRMLEELIPAARLHRVITALDPKPGNLSPVKNLTVIKPNRNEAFAMAGIRDSAEGGNGPEHDAPLAAAAEKLRREWTPEYLLVSLAAQGMALFGPDGVRVIPTRAREVYDVSGAGDTVTAVFTLSLVAGASPDEAAELANFAAGAVVAKIGTAPITLEEMKGVRPPQ